ncbi:MAG TPA: hypothetical protein VFW50_37955 [Streptosporangiaceae bacterium]|nr:hypothetical protein [Streptosporangiaceae bacterium]
MAKALLGHVRGPDQRVAAEVRRLRQRVGDLEAQLARLREERGAVPPGSPPASPASQAVPLGPAAPPEPRQPSA